MRKFIVNVNGSSYEVEVEEISGASAAPAAPAASVKAPAAVHAPAAPVTSNANAKGNPIVAPMPGTILDVKTSIGSQVKKGQVIIILEAMKMENEVLADRDGTVTALNVSKGSNVKSGDVLCLIG